MKLWKPLATLSLCLFICLFAFSEVPQRLKHSGTRMLDHSGDPGNNGDSGNILSSTNFHTIMSYVFWGPVADIGIIILRMFRGTNFKFGRYGISYQAIHGVVMSVVVIISLIVSMSVNNDKEGANQAATNFHTTVGTIIMITMFITAITGGASYLTLRAYNKGVQPKIYNKIIHRLLGVIVYLIAKANIITGAIIFMNDALLTVTWIYIGLLFLVYLIIESTVFYAYYSANRPIRTNAKPTKEKVTSDLVAAINQGESQTNLRDSFPHVKWLMVHNKIYDLTSFIHPGGNFVIEACIGREVGRFFYGNHALENSKQKAYKHSALTVSQMNKFFIGELTNYESILSLNLDGTEKENHHETTETYSWKLADVVPISSSTAQFCFQNDKVKVKNFGKSLSWLGRHFQVSFDNNISPARQYTTAMCLNKANIQFRQSLYAYFDQIMKDPTSTQKFNFDANYLQDQMYLPFVIKKYDLSQTNLSKALHKIQPEQSASKFRVEGPFGRGLELTTASTGSHCIICVGTGILPVIDFLCLFLWKTIYDLIKNKAGIEKAQQINVWNIPFDSYFNGMKLTFVGGFANESEFIGLDIVKKLAEINKKYGLDTFKAMVKGYSDENMVPVKERFSKEFLEKQVGLTMERYYVVGSWQMNSQISKDLAQLGVSREKIMLV